MTNNGSSTARGKGGADGLGNVRVADGTYRYGKRRLFAIVYYEAGADGTRKQRWVRGFKTLDEAKKARTKALSDISRGIHVKPSKQTVQGFFDEWEKATRPLQRGSSAAMREHNFRTNILPYFGARKLQELRPDDIAAWHARLLIGTERLSPSKRPLSARSVRLMHGHLRTMLRDAVAWGRVAVNVCDAVRPPRFVTPEMHTWTATQMGTFIGYVREHEPDWLGLYMLAASSGARRGELLAVQWQDIDLAAGTWQVRRSIVALLGDLYENEPKTAAGRRRIQLDSGTLAALTEHRRRVAEAALALGQADALAPTGRVFPGWLLAPGSTRRRRGPDGTLSVAAQGAAMGIVAPNVITLRFRELSAEAGLPRIRFHDLRHSWATLALASGLSPKIVQERLGHANISTTLGVYSHVSESIHRDAAEQLGAAMFGGPSS